SEEAAELAGEHKLYKIHLASGKTATVGTLESAEEFGKQSGEEYTIEATQAQINKGNKDEIYAVLTEIQAKYQADELIVTTGIR
ncbi:alkane 1-monooxygenase, partial [Bacillus cereus]|nr:alkane 1-monooxygenase [Bacillus cereus]